jgi:hypothetical protein
MHAAKFTEQQIKDWYEYEEVRLSGLYNMYSPQARELTGLDKESYLFVMRNYSELKEQASE